MAEKQFQGAVYAPDGSLYVTLTDGDGNLTTIVGAGDPAGEISIGSTVINGGSDGNFLYNNLGTVGERNASATRSALSLVPGTDVQVHDAGLDSISGLTTAADNMIYTIASDTYATTPITSFGRSLVDDANASAARTTLGLGTAATQNTSAFLQPGNNLSDVSNAATARTNLGLGTAATTAATDYLAVANNLSDLNNAATARTNLGLGTAATTAATNYLAVANNLSDVPNDATARTNLGLGTMATQNSSLISVTGGSIVGITDLAVADGGTGASTAAGARSNLGLVIDTDVVGVSSLDIDGTLAANSDLKIATQKATKTYADTKVAGPASATDLAIARFDGTTGKLVQNSPILLSDTTGALTKAGGGGFPIQGTNTSDAAGTGFIGEYISSAIVSGSAVSVTTSTVTNLTSISLTAGDWDVAAIAYFKGAASTNVTRILCGISQSSATFDTSPGAYSDTYFGSGIVPGATANPSTSLIPWRVSIAATTTVYLVVLATFTVSTAAFFGEIRARRVR